MPPKADTNANATAVAQPNETVAEERAAVAHRPHPGDSLQARLDPSAGPTRLGDRYVLLREIGRGAIGVVYAAYHEGLDRKLAIKVLNKQRAGRADLEARLHREAKALAKLSHPNVVHVYDVGNLEGRWFIAMEFVEGEPLTDWMRREHTVAEIVAMFADAGRGLAAAHEAGVVHRDFKPDNVLVGRDGRPRVLDFGLARAVERAGEDGMVGSRSRSRESGPIGASLDLLLTGARGRGTSVPLARANQPAAREASPQAGPASPPAPSSAKRPDSPAKRPDSRPRVDASIDPDETVDGEYTPEPDPDELATATNVGAPPPIHDQDVIATATNIADPREPADPREARDGTPPTKRRPSSVEATLDAPEDLFDHQLSETMASDPGESPHGKPEMAETQQSDPGLDSHEAGDVLTRTGAMMGTPAYMSPEQFLGKRVDQASDQFSFCIALHEALYGRRPYAGKTPMDLALATQAGRIVDAPPNSQVPTWLREVLLRGLQPSADARFESMNELIAELVRDRESPRRRWPLALALGGVATVALVIGVFAPTKSPCPTIEATAAEQWSADLASELGGAFGRSPLPYASAAWAGVEPRLRDWADSWATQRVEACEATHVRHEFSTEVLDLRQACLERELRAFQALIEQLRAGDATVIEHALEATVMLPEPARCGDVDALLSGLAAPPDAVANEVEQLRTTLTELDALANTGRWRQGLSLAELAVEQARRSNYGPVVAEALLTHARLLAGTGASEQAVEQLQDALDEAERSGHDGLVPRIAIELVSLSIYARPDPIRGRVWARRALASLDHIDEHGYLRARGIWSLANLDRLDGEYVPAEAALREAIALLEAQAAGHPDRAIMRNDLGVAIAARGEVELARETYSEALRESIESFGAAHPRVANVYFNLARLEFAQGRLDESRTQLEHARRIYVDAHGPRHRDVGSVEMVLAAIDVASERLDQAKTHASLAEQIYAVELDPDNVDRAEPRLLLGHIAFAGKQYDEAAEHYRAGLALQQAALPPGHISMADTHTNLGLVALTRGDPDAAVGELERAVDLLEAGVGVDPATLIWARLYLGDALLARGTAGDARQAARRFAAALDGCEPAPLCETLQIRLENANAAATVP
jgi:serine/threonine protein kinase/tetratricopeptide (TPR) repeat protein